MRSQLYYLVVFSCTSLLHTLANSESNTDKNDVIVSNPDIQIDSPSTTKSSEGMPASVVILLLFMFIALGFIGIRHIRREYLQNQMHSFRKQTGTLFQRSGLSHAKSYGSTLSPQLNASNIDEYIDDQLYGNNEYIRRVSYHFQNIQQRFVDWMEATPPPVMYEVNDGQTESVGAYCNDPQIPNNPNYEHKPFQNSHNYNPTASDALQQMFQANYDKNERKNIENNRNERECKAFEEIKEKKSSVNNNNESESSDGYEAISDSDKDISDSDNGNADQNNKIKNDKPVLTTKIVVLDLD